MKSKWNVCAWLCIGIVAFGAATAKAEELGRLFFTAAQRKALDDKRMLSRIKPEAKGTDTASLESETVSPTAENESVLLPEPKITGKVIRSSGNNTIWMNHHPQYMRPANRGKSE